MTRDEIFDYVRRHLTDAEKRLNLNDVYKYYLLMTDLDTEEEWRNLGDALKYYMQ